MKLLCPACLATVTVPDALALEAGAKVRCPNCRTDFAVSDGSELGALPSDPTDIDSGSSLPVSPPPLLGRPFQRSSTSLPAFKPAAAPKAAAPTPPNSPRSAPRSLFNEHRESASMTKWPSPAAPATNLTSAALPRADASVAFGWEQPSVAPKATVPQEPSSFSEQAGTDADHEQLTPDEAVGSQADAPKRQLPVAMVVEGSLPAVTVAITAVAMLICLVGGWLLWIAYQNDGLIDLRRLDRTFGELGQVVQPASMRNRPEAVAPVGVLGSLKVVEIKQSIYLTAAGIPLVVVEGYVLNQSSSITYRRIALRVTATSLRDEVYIDRRIPAGALLEQPAMEAIKDGATLARTYDALERQASKLQVAPGQRTPFSAVALVPAGIDLTDATVGAVLLDAEQLVPEACWRPATGAEGSGL